MSTSNRPETTTATVYTTTSRPSRIITTRKSTTTTEQPDNEEDYEDDAEDQPQAGGPQYTEELDEEDPKVIKELIDLIKKVGGIEQLERQLNLDGNADVKTSEKKAGEPLISKALYHKVLNSASGRSFMPRNRYSFATNRTGAVSSSTEGAVLVQSAVSGNKYSSVIRNSRPSAQNEGVDRLKPESQKLQSETKQGRPQYVTIQRPSVRPAKNSEEDEEDEEDDVDDDAEEVVAIDEVSGSGNRKSNSHTSTTAHPQYVNIQRRRGSTTAKPTVDEDDDEETDDAVDEDVEDENVSTHKQYSTLERRRNPVQQQNAKPDEEEKKASVGGIRCVLCLDTSRHIEKLVANMREMKMIHIHHF